MFRALRVGLTGLQATQQQIDVIGNNLTNSQTPGFKSDRVTFRDAFYQSFNTGSGPTGNLGGVNGRQIGLGTRVGGIDHNFLQGSIIDTGRTFDMALQGNGFFVLSDGNSQTFSRVGTFDLDREGSLVDTRTGFKVLNPQGQPVVLDRDAVQPATPTTEVPLRGNLPAEVTGPLPEIQGTAFPFGEALGPTITSAGLGTSVNLTGLTLTLLIDDNEPVDLTFTAADTNGTPPAGLAQPPGSLATIIQDKIDGLMPPLTNPPIVSASGGEITILGTTTGTASRIEVSGGAATSLNLAGIVGNGSEDTAIASTLLNDLATNQVDYVAGDEILITGVASDGSTVSSVFTFGTGAGQDGETLGDLQASIDAAFPGSTVSLAGGGITVATNASGESPLNIVLQDGPNNTGNSSLSIHSFETTQAGTGPDTVTTALEIFDSLGINHTLTGVFERQENGSWRLEVSLPEDEGSVNGSPIADIQFNSDGTFQGGALTSLQVSFANGSAPQSVEFDLGDPNSLTGLSQFGADATARFDTQNGSPAGTLTGFSVTQGGVIQGSFSNGTVVDLETVGIAKFKNVAGLAKEGGTFFSRTDNSGEPILGNAQIDGRAVIVSGALEDSNVDTSAEFVRLIASQRSFQSSARVITSANELFNEVLQLI